MTESAGYESFLEPTLTAIAAEENTRALLADILLRMPAFVAALHGPSHIFDLANPLYYQLVGHRDIIGKPVAEAMPEIVEQGFVALLDQVYQTGEPFMGKDVPALLQVEPNGPLEERFVDFTFQPFFGADGAVTGILVHGIDLTERRNLTLERERLLAEEHARAERETLLNQISEAVRSTLNAEEILRLTIAALGHGLGADRCFIVHFEKAHGAGRVSPEWVRAEKEIPPFGNQTRRMSPYALRQDWASLTGRTTVVNDLALRSLEEAAVPLDLNLRALLRVPITVGGSTTALAVAMDSESRVWTQEEVHLVETVTALLRSTLESLQIQHRERNIAQQLQEALLPPPPGDLPGLRLASYYRPALGEAQVGGDFFDVFPITGKPGCTAIVVADLSGKGLAAAQQVSTVRNMLRYALYTCADTNLAEAVGKLSETLVDHALLTGFATLFVGLYDQTGQSLTYVNCGQEPGLLWRSQTRIVEMLEATGPILGGFSGGEFHQQVVQLSSGDVLALFTDGLTEVGPDRKVMLEVEGVSEVLRLSCFTMKYENRNDPGFIVSRLIAGTDAFARGGARDDIALLVGTVP